MVSEHSESGAELVARTCPAYSDLLHITFNRRDTTMQTAPALQTDTLSPSLTKPCSRRLLPMPFVRHQRRRIAQCGSRAAEGRDCLVMECLVCGQRWLQCTTHAAPDRRLQSLPTRHLFQEAMAQSWSTCWSHVGTFTEPGCISRLAHRRVRGEQAA